MYDVSSLREMQKEFNDKAESHFRAFFKQVDYANLTKGKIKIHKVSNPDDLRGALSGAGFYLIATNYMSDANGCTLEISPGLKVIYRGHASSVSRRLESHLFNALHRSRESGRKFDVCMKLGKENGINIDAEPYRDYTWEVVCHSMHRSTEPMREAAERAFDATFGRPLGSRS